MTYTEEQRRLAAAWKATSPTLPDQARVSAPYVGKHGGSRGPAYDFCLPVEHARLSLLPDVREPALALFAELGIPWHAGVAGGPSNHLLSSQVQCVNALGRMVSEPALLVAAFGDLLGMHEALEIEPGRFLTFEYIGPRDCFGEAPSGQRVRGAHCTSVDAAFVHRTTDGLVELVLLEWKYTESYGRRPVEPDKDEVRWRRYGAAWADPQGPVTDALSFAEVLQEPLYQLVRQQLLAHELEKERVLGADRVRVVHASPAGNDAYQRSLQPSARMLGDTVNEVWSRLIRTPDRFLAVDSALFLDADITSAEYVLRYAADAIADVASLLAVTGAETAAHVEDVLYGDDDFDGDVWVDDSGIDLRLGDRSRFLAYPFTPRLLHQAAEDLQRDAEDEEQEPA